MFTILIGAMTVYHKSVGQYFRQYFNLKEVWFEVTEMHQKVILKFKRSAPIQSDLVSGLVNSVSNESCGDCGKQTCSGESYLSVMGS